MQRRSPFAHRLTRLALGVLAVAPVAWPPAQAQVTTNTDALSALPPDAPPHSADTGKTGASPRSAPGHKASSRPEAAPASSATPPAASKSAEAVQRHAGDSAAHPVLRSAPLPPIPPAPPPQPVFVAPSLYVPLHSFPIPDDVPAVKDAKGGAAAIEGGQRLTFAAGSADLSPAMRQAVLDFAADLSAHPDARADVDSYAGGTSDDLSTPRRLSLTRGLSVRAILIHAGIASTRIYVRPIGLASATDTPVATGADAPADHLDLTRSDLVPTHAPPAPGTPATPSQEATP